MRGRMRKGLLAAATAGSLAFGAAQAFAAPQKAAAAADTCTSAERRYCLTYCVQNGGDGAFCDYGQCICY